jgi:hypothetical protein
MKCGAVLVFVPLALLLTRPPTVGAKLCGDDVGGADVPCACGDVVVSDLVLGDDPVTEAPCPDDGLVVRAPGAGHAVTIDLHGKTLRGSARGVGVWVLAGGPGGARLVSTGGPATIQGFRDGVVANGRDSLAAVDGVVAAGSTRDGFRVDAPGYELRNAEARDSGRDGFGLMGKGFRVSATRAIRSARWGYYVMGDEGTLGAAGAGPVAEASGKGGFSVMGMGHQLVECAASGSGEHGLQLWGMHFTILRSVATGNHRDGINGMGVDWWLAGNQANDNDGDGIVVGGIRVADQGGNAGSGNRGLREQGRARQCEIGDHACQP